MITLHRAMSGTFAATAMDGPWAHPMMHAPGAMGWAMFVEPVTMALWVAGIASLVVALVRSFAKAA